MITCLDIGGNNTRIGFSKDKKTFTRIIKFSTKNTFEEQVKSIAKQINKIAKDINTIVIAQAGLLDSKKGILISWGQRNSWKNKNIFTELFKYFPDTNLYLENDANIAALGEAVLGAGKNFSTVGYVTLSSGVGGGLVVNKQIQPYAFAIEPGHQIVNTQETKVWNCGQKGCFEAYASGTAFEQIFGISPKECTDQVIWGKYAKLLAPGVANLVAVWSPEIMVLGGGVSNKFDLFIKPLKEELINLLPMYKIPQISKSKLVEPGLYGGLVYYKIFEEFKN